MDALSFFLQRVDAWETKEPSGQTGTPRRTEGPCQFNDLGPISAEDNAGRFGDIGTSMAH
jgi:hypothetical protein